MINIKFTHLNLIFTLDPRNRWLNLSKGDYVFRIMLLEVNVRENVRLIFPAVFLRVCYGSDNR